MDPVLVIIIQLFLMRFLHLLLNILCSITDFLGHTHNVTIQHNKNLA